MSKAQVREERNERAYFTMLPNMVLDDLDPYAGWLYAHLKRIAGDGGVVEIDTKELAARCQMSVGKVCECKAALVVAGLIEVSTSDVSARAPHAIAVMDIWQVNMARFSRSPHEREAVSRSPHERRCSPHERDHIEKEQEIKNKKEGATSAPRPNFDELAKAAGIQNQKPARKRKTQSAPAIEQKPITAEMLSHFAVVAHREIMGVLLDGFAMEQIIGQVTDEPRWRECLTDWRLHLKWQRDNLASQLDRYRQWYAIKAKGDALMNAGSTKDTQTGIADSWLEAARAAGMDMNSLQGEPHGN